MEWAASIHFPDVFSGIFTASLGSVPYGSKQNSEVRRQVIQDVQSRLEESPLLNIRRSLRTRLFGTVFVARRVMEEANSRLQDARDGLNHPNHPIQPSYWWLNDISTAGLLREYQSDQQPHFEGGSMG